MCDIVGNEQGGVAAVQHIFILYQPLCEGRFKICNISFSFQSELIEHRSFSIDSVFQLVSGCSSFGADAVDYFIVARNCQIDRCSVVFLRTFSKAYGIPGLRVGYGIMHESIAECLHKVRQPFNVNHMAQIGAVAALLDEDHYKKTLDNTKKGLEYLMSGVKELGCGFYKSHTNFFLVDVGGDSDSLYEAMLYKGVIIRSMSAYGFKNCIRVTVGTEAENSRFLRALGECLSENGYK